MYVVVSPEADKIFKKEIVLQGHTFYDSDDSWLISAV